MFTTTLLIAFSGATAVLCAVQWIRTWKRMQAMHAQTTLIIADNQRLLTAADKSTETTTEESEMLNSHFGISEDLVQEIQADVIADMVEAGGLVTPECTAAVEHLDTVGPPVKGGIVACLKSAVEMIRRFRKKPSHHEPKKVEKSEDKPQKRTRRRRRNDSPLPILD